MKKRQCYILLGDDLTGKTTFQKYLVWHLCRIDKFTRLDTNLTFHVNHPESPRKVTTLFTINRSIQEKMGEYLSVENYFNKYFQTADICILSSHTHGNSIDVIREMIVRLHEKYYDVDAVFFTNCLNISTSEISKLNWNTRIIIENPSNQQSWEKQIELEALRFTDLIIRHSKLN